MASRSTSAPDDLSSKDSLVDDAILKVVWRQIGPMWKELGRELQIPEWQLDDIFQQNHTLGIAEMAFQMLRVWTQNASTKASVSFLAAGLEEIGRKDIADVIMALPQNSSAANRYLDPQEDNLESEWLRRLASKLRRKYQKYVMKGLPWMGNIKISLADYYVDLSVQTSDSNEKITQGDNMMMPSSQGKGHLTIAERVRWKLRRSRGLNPAEKRESTDINEVFKSAFSSNKHPLRILVEAPPGYGKTTLSAKLCFDNATPEDYIKNFDLVLHLSLRNFEGNLEKMFYRAADLSDSRDQDMLKCINNPSNRILLVLDGYDEIPKQHVKAVLALLQGQQFPHVAVVVTSRPGHFSFERWETENAGCAAQCDLTLDWNGIWQSRINILGINESMKAVFIKKHLMGFPENIRSEVLFLIKQFGCNNIIQSEFLECPLFLLMIILLATGEENCDIQTLKTRTDLYKSVFNFIIRRYCSKLKVLVNEKIDLFAVSEALKPFYVDLLSQFGEFAFGALIEDKISFSRDEILGNDQQRDPRILELGLLTQSVFKTGFKEKTVYEPVHKSLLEFSATYALWQQSLDSDRHIWAEKVVRFWRYENRGRPFCLPMLAGLMQTGVPALLDVLLPYVICGVWVQWLRRSVSEIELTKSVVSSVTPFLPIYWRQEDEDCFSKTQHDTLLFQGIRAGRIKRVELTGFLNTPMPDDVVVEKAEFSGIDDAVINAHKFNCKHLVFRNANVFQRLEFFSTINFETLSFVFSSNVSSQLRLLCSAISVGALRGTQIRFIQCEIEENAKEIVMLLTELIKMNKLNALRITISWVQSSSVLQETLNSLLKAAANSFHLTCLLLRNDNSLSPFTLDLGHLCGGVKKTWEFLSVRDFNVKFTPQIGQTFQVKCLVLDCPDVPEVLFRFCKVTSLHCYLPLLANIENLKFFPEYLTELNIIVDKTAMNAKQSCLPHLPNLNVLMLTMRGDVPPTFPVRDFLFSSNNFLRLKGIEVWDASQKPELSLEFIKCVSDCLKDSIAIPTTCEGNKKLRNPHSLQLEYFLLRCLFDHYFFDVLREMKTPLINKSLSRVDIVLLHQPCSPDLFDVFSPAEGFRVETDLWGTRSEHTILSRMQYATQSSWNVTTSFSHCH